MSQARGRGEVGQDNHLCYRFMRSGVAFHVLSVAVVAARGIAIFFF